MFHDVESANVSFMFGKAKKYANGICFHVVLIILVFLHAIHYHSVKHVAKRNLANIMTQECALYCVDMNL